MKSDAIFKKVSHRRARGERRGYIIFFSQRSLRTLRWTISFFFDLTGCSRSAAAFVSNKKTLQAFSAWRVAPSFLGPQFDCCQVSVPTQSYGGWLRQVFWLPRLFSYLPITIHRNSGIPRLKRSRFHSNRKRRGYSGGTTSELHGIPY